MSSDKLPFRPTKNEHIIAEIKRSKVPYVIIGLLGLGGSLFFFITFLQMYSSGKSWLGGWFGISQELSLNIASTFAAISIICLIFSLIAAYVYGANRMFITNEHVVLIKQFGIVATDKKVVNHLNIEDAKYRQNVAGKLLNYGKLTISTEAQATVYELGFVHDPEEYTNIIIDTRDQYQSDLVTSGGGGAIPIKEKR